MPGVALVLWVVFGLLAFGGRVLLQLRQTGSTGVRGVSGAPGSREWLGGVLFLSSLALGVLGAALELADVVGPIDPLDHPSIDLAGIFLFAGGLVLTLGAQLAMGASWRIGVDESERTDLVTDGPFAVVRNPIYSGMIPAVAGLALLAPNVISLVALAGLIVAIEIQVRGVEEPHLLRAHGDAYADYAAGVGRFVPGVGRLRSARS
jgi:protein-S-isoprenylcysteine O-methyltransferase Ste14